MKRIVTIAILLGLLVCLVQVSAGALNIVQLSMDMLLEGKVTSQSFVSTEDNNVNSLVAKTGLTFLSIEGLKVCVLGKLPDLKGQEIVIGLQFIRVRKEEKKSYSVYRIVYFDKVE